MPLRRPLRLTRPLQIGFLILLAVSSAQLAWWLVDQVEYSAAVRARLREGYAADERAASALLRAGMRWNDIARLYPDLRLAADSATVTVDPRVMVGLEQQRFHRLNRYAWEGAFFLAVLLGAMAVVYVALRREAELRRSQEHFLAAVSHELKSPLTSLRLSIETLALRDPPAGRRAELVQRLLADVGRLERMIANVLDTSRLAAATAHTRPERLALAEVVAAAVEEVREHAAECEVTIATDVPPSLTVRADREGARTVLRNLLHNAIKAACGGGNVTVRATGPDGRVRLEVRDDGVGFPPHEAPRLFDKFYKLDSEARARMNGTGLGLYLVRRCLELDGGTVHAESAGAGRGAVFTVNWPAAGSSSV